MNKLTALILVILCGVATTATVAPPEAKPRLGMNLAGPADWMGDMYRRHYNEWAKLGGDVFAVFSSIGQYSNHGAWGLAEYYDSQPADYPKLAAALEWAKKHGQPVELENGK